MVVAICAGNAFCQNVSLSHVEKGQPHIPATPESFRLSIVQAGIENGLSAKRKIPLHRMGDEAALDTLKIIGTNQSLSQTTKDNIVAVLQEAFAKPQMIVNAADREPKLTMFLLQWLGSSADNLPAKDRVDQARQQIQDSLDQKKDTPQQ
jgi:hypothetical protein